MNSFLVLGQIPGTNFQISFSAWLNIAGVLLAVIIISKALRSRQANRAVVTVQTTRTHLHATQLHQRAQ